MLTIDWKERLRKDSDEFIAKKLPVKDYDFEIIYKAYPARVNGKIPHEVIAFVAQYLAQKISRVHEQYLPFYQYLWDKKGESGKLAFTYMVSRFVLKKPDMYFPLVEKAINSADAANINNLLDKILLPLIKKDSTIYLPYIFRLTEHKRDEVSKLSMSVLLKMIKKDSELIPSVFAYYKHQWSYPIEHHQHNHTLLLKALGKIDRSMYLSVYEEYRATRDPQTVEVLCSGVYDYDPRLYDIVENWTHSGNARLKKAAMAAFKILGKKSK